MKIRRALPRGKPRSEIEFGTTFSWACGSTTSTIADAGRSARNLDLDTIDGAMDCECLRWEFKDAERAALDRCVRHKLPCRQIVVPPLLATLRSGIAKQRTRVREQS